MNHSIFIILIFSLPFISYAQFDYLPSTIPGHQVIEYTQFTLSYNKTHDQADWVAYVLTKDEALMEVPRCSNCYKADENVLLGSARDDDYTNTGFDRGHLSPSEDNQNSEAVNRESFLMSNMSPQLHRFNDGIWKEYEAWVREKAIEFDTIYVVTGPVFINTLGSIGTNSVTIPGYFYKSLLRFDEENKPKTIAFLIPHINAVGTLKDYVVSVNTLETLTEIDFYPDLDDEDENRVESTHSTSQWGL